MIDIDTFLLPQSSNYAEHNFYQIIVDDADGEEDMDGWASVDLTLIYVYLSIYVIAYLSFVYLCICIF